MRYGDDYEDHHPPEDDSIDLDHPQECESCGEMVRHVHDLNWTVVCDDCVDEAREDEALDRAADRRLMRAEAGYPDA